MIHQPQLRGWHRVAQYNQKQVSIKRFLKRNLAHVGMVQCMNALADKVHKQEVPIRATATYVGIVVE